MHESSKIRTNRLNAEQTVWQSAQTIWTPNNPPDNLHKVPERLHEASEQLHKPSEQLHKVSEQLHEASVRCTKQQNVRTHICPFVIPITWESKIVEAFRL